MSSKTAMEKHSGGVAEYRASEGKTVKVKYKGPVAETVKDILGGVRSTCTYVGASQLKELSKRTTFIRVQEQHNEVFETNSLDKNFYSRQYNYFICSEFRNGNYYLNNC